MELRNLKTFVKVCDFMSLSKAADYLGYSQSTVTTQIQQLEKELGVMLLDRTGKHFIISEKGKELFCYASEITKLAAEAHQAVTDISTPKGTLRIGTIESVCSFALPLIIEKYMDKCPAVNLQIKTATTLEIMDMLRKNQVDLIMTLDEPVYDIDWTTAWTNEEDILFLCSRAHHFARWKKVTLDDLVRENIILTEKHCNYRETFERICEKHSLEYISSIEIGNTNIILDLTEKNRGVTFLPRIAVENSVRNDKICTFEVEGCAMKMEIQIIHKKNKWVSPAMREFIEMTAKNLGNVKY